MFAWLLQVVNAFSLQTDVEIKAKVITRLCNMTDLHQLLNKSLAGNDDIVDVSCGFGTQRLQLAFCTQCSLQVNTYIAWCCVLKQMKLFCLLSVLLSCRVLTLLLSFYPHFSTLTSLVSWVTGRHPACEGTASTIPRSSL